jgi:hypothetical protein
MEGKRLFFYLVAEAFLKDVRPVLILSEGNAWLKI